MNRDAGMNAGLIIGTMNGLQVVGLDIAKPVFQLLVVDTFGSVSKLIIDGQLRRHLIFL